MATTSKDARMRPDERPHGGDEPASSPLAPEAVAPSRALSPEPPSADDAVLDDLFEHVLAAAESGEDFDLERWLVGRDHLRDAAQQALVLARDVAVNVERAPRATPRSIAGYELVRELGRGSMGAVFLARQTALGGRLVALKLLPVSAALSDRARQRFLIEARALAKVRHRHVVAVHDVVEAGEVCAYSMEWVEGASLAELLRAVREAKSRSGSLHADQVLRDAARDLGLVELAAAAPPATVWLCRVVIAIARALGEVHRTGLLHRDVKPSNILLRSDGMPLLSDFGLVRESDAERHTQTGNYLGTPSYSAPEQLRGDHDVVDARSDVYSLAATLYESLTGRVPHTGRSPAEILARAESGAFAPARKLDRTLPRDLDAIFATALDPVPARRYLTADEFADDLERLLALQPIRARPASWLERAAKLLRRNRRVALAATVASALVLGPSIWLGARIAGRGRRVDEALRLQREAQQALLDPAQANLVFGAAYPESRTEHNNQGTDLGSRVAKALQLYGDALAVGPPQPLTSEIELERDVITLARSVASRTAPLEIGAKLAEQLPLTAQIASEWTQRPFGSRASKDELVRASQLDRRHLGLLAFLLGDAPLSIEAWKDSSLSIPADGLADAALGELYLILDRAELAYPRLLNACAVYKKAGFLYVDLADSAVRVGDLDAAERLVDRAQTLSMHDPFDNLVCVRADLHAARGQDAQARELYEWMTVNHQSPSGFQHYAHFLEQRGELQQALRIQMLHVAHHPEIPAYQAELLRVAEAWWNTLPPSSLLASLRDLIEIDLGDGTTALEVLDLIRAEFSVTGEQEKLEVMPYVTDPSSSSRQRPSLRELAHRTEGRIMSLDELLTAPRLTQRIQICAWSSPWPRLLSSALRPLGASLRVAARALPLLLGSATLSLDSAMAQGIVFDVETTDLTAVASFAQGGCPAANTINGITCGCPLGGGGFDGWAVSPNEASFNSILWGFVAGSRQVDAMQIDSTYYAAQTPVGPHTLGKFDVVFTTDPNPTLSSTFQPLGSCQRV